MTTTVKETEAQELVRLRAEKTELEAKLKARAPTTTMKVSQKGALSVYGLGRFPTTLYASQWERVEGLMGSIMAFIKDHEGELARKDT